MSPFKISKVRANATIPVRQSCADAGYDLSSCEAGVVPAKSRKLFDSGIAIQIPEDCYARVAPRSGLALKKGIDTGAGVIDASYRGSIGIILFNHSDDDFEVNVGDRIAQLIFEKIYTPELEEVAFDVLSTTERGADGIGSTGL
jgi:dUTP pyrophosphatase